MLYSARQAVTDDARTKRRILIAQIIRGEQSVLQEKITPEQKAYLKTLKIKGKANGSDE